MSRAHAVLRLSHCLLLAAGSLTFCHCNAATPARTAATAMPAVPAAPTPDVDGIRQVVHTELSNVGTVYVVDEGDLRYLRFDSPDGGNQSVISRSNTRAVPMEYVRMSAIGLAHAPLPESMLMIGLGAGAFSTLLYRSLPTLVIDVVEISPAIHRIARDFFGLPSDPRYRVNIADGAAFVDKITQKYDLFYVDAYTGTDLPEHLTTADFFERLRQSVTPQGVVMLNLAVWDDRELAIVAAFEEVFGPAVCYRGKLSDNLVVVGTLNAPLGEHTIAKRARELDRSLDLPFSLADQATLVVQCPQ